MPPVPKKKHTKARSGKRVHGKKLSLNVSHLTKCPSCGALRFSHTQCGACGYTYSKK